MARFWQFPQKYTDPSINIILEYKYVRVRKSEEL